MHVVSWAPERPVDRFSRFYTGLIGVTSPQTDRQTDHATCDICSNSPRLAVLEMLVVRDKMSDVVCLSVCLLVCLSVCLSARTLDNYTAELHQVCVHVVAVARSSSDGVGIHYVLPVL